MTKAPNRKPRLTPEQKQRIVDMLNQQIAVATIAADTGVSLPTIYGLKRKVEGRNEPTRGVGAAAANPVAILEQEVAAAEARIADLEKSIAELESLRDEVTVKTSVIKTLKELAAREGAK
jgi:transposase-like protein